MGMRRKFAGAAAAMVMAAGAVGLGAGPAGAGGCSSPGPCGRVNNDTGGDTMRYTLRLDDGASDRCNVWNFPGGQKTVSCAQEGLAPGGSKGGWYHDKTDVDAFTFPDSGYHVSFNGGITQSYHERGMWTKIASLDTITCKDTGDFETPYCFAG
jgi:hypothetical protein